MLFRSLVFSGRSTTAGAIQRQALLSRVSLIYDHLSRSSSANTIVQTLWDAIPVLFPRPSLPEIQQPDDRPAPRPYGPGSGYIGFISTAFPDVEPRRNKRAPTVPNSTGRDIESPKIDASALHPAFLQQPPAASFALNPMLLLRRAENMGRGKQFQFGCLAPTASFEKIARSLPKKA